MTTLTAAGTALLTQIGRRGFSYFDDGIVAGSGIWEECMTGEAGDDVASTATGVALVIRKLVRDGYLESSHDGTEESPWLYLTELGARTALELASPIHNQAKEATMSTVQLQSLKPGQLFVYKGETLQLVKINATSFRASVASGEVKSFKARPTVKVETADIDVTADAPVEETAPAPADEDLIGTATTTSTVKWQGKVRETKTTVTIIDHGKGTDPRWSMTCEDHGNRETRKTSTEVWAESAHPLAWCPGCQKAAK